MYDNLFDIIGDNDIPISDMGTLIVPNITLPSSTLEAISQLELDYVGLMVAYLPTFNPFCGNDDFFNIISSNLSPEDQYRYNEVWDEINKLIEAIECWFRSLPCNFQNIIRISSIVYGEYLTDDPNYLRLSIYRNEGQHEYVCNNPTQYGIPIPTSGNSRNTRFY